MSMHSHQGYDDSIPTPSPPRSVDMTNPGTAAHVRDEFGKNLQDLYSQREQYQARYDESTNEYHALMKDVNERISMAEAAGAAYDQMQPVQEAPRATTKVPR